MSPDEHMKADFEDKVAWSEQLIVEWHTYWKGEVYVAFSGGRDSTVLLHLVRSIYPDTTAVFSNTGLEYPEIVKFAKSFDNVTEIRPEKNFRSVLMEDGFPISSKKTADMLGRLRNPTATNFNTRRLYLTGYSTRTGKYNKASRIAKKWFPFIWSDLALTEACCGHLKKNPMKKFQKETGLKPIVGMRMGEGNNRDKTLKGRQCNITSGSNLSSIPLKFWSDNDIQTYIDLHKLELCSVYKDFNLKRTGCTFCAYGAEMEKGEDNRFVKLQKSHPKQYVYFIDKLGMSEGLDAAGIEYGKESTGEKLTVKDIPNYKCVDCGNKYSMLDIGFITQREATRKEIITKSPTLGMDIHCRPCASIRGLPHA